MKRLLILLTLCQSLWAAPAIVHRYNVTSAPVTLTAVGTGNTIVAAVDASVTPASVHITGGTGGSQTLVAYGAPLINTWSHISWWVLKTTGASAGETSLTCTTCGTVNAVHVWEISGTDTTNTVDHLVTQTSTNDLPIGPTHKTTFNPGFSAEAILFAGNCSGSASSMTATGVTLTSGFPNGEPGADGIISAAGTLTITPDSGCASSGAGDMIMGIKGAAGVQACTWDASYFDYSAQGTSGTHPSISATIVTTGDLVAVVAWCITTCGAGTLTVGSDSATQTSVSGNSSATTGQPFIWYDITAVSGPQTITWTPTGSWTNNQIAYYDFVPSAGCTIAHDVDSSLGTGNGTAVNTPSITATVGDLEFGFTASAQHVTAVNSPWICNNYSGTSERFDCMFVNSVNADYYILSASGSSTANNVTQLTGDWQALLTSFKLTGSGATVKRMRGAVIQTP